MSAVIEIYHCPEWPHECKCELCECGQPLHASDHAPKLFGWSNKPLGHWFSPVTSITFDTVDEEWLAFEEPVMEWE